MLITYCTGMKLFKKAKSVRKVIPAQKQIQFRKEMLFVNEMPNLGSQRE